MNPQPTSVPGSLRALLSDAIDFAGAFPPANLSVDAAFQEYLSYRELSESFLLARFVVPIAKLHELLPLLETTGNDPNQLALGGPIRLAVYCEPAR